jgi:hypothetical protein
MTRLRYYLFKAYTYNIIRPIEGLIESYKWIFPDFLGYLDYSVTSLNW